MEENLYPHIESPDLNKKITLKREFSTTKVKGYSKDDYKNIATISDKLCAATDFELSNHQQFVRNFLSFETPYNSLLLYHGLGTGKTCSSISICEETRKYMKLMGYNKKIIVIASPVVQENYKLQLFDPRKLEKIDGYWNLKACTSNKFIEEINPMFTKDVTRSTVIKKINKIIKNWYHFMGYEKFSNYITEVIKKANIKLTDTDLKDKSKIEIIEKEFSNRVIVIDEVHNIRTGENMKRTSEHFLNLVKYAKNTKLILLTATPMYNDHREIVWLLNLMNLNDGRYMLKEKDLFDKKGNLLVDKSGKEVGKETLIQKSTGYFSYVRGNNPFIFPFHILPETSGRPESLKILNKRKDWLYPLYQINDLKIVIPIQHLDLFITNIGGTVQEKAYNLLIEKLKKENEVLQQKNEGIQYTIVDGPLQILNMVYPTEDLISNSKIRPSSIEKMYGSNGLLRLMKRESNKKDYQYKDSTIEKFGRIFSEEHIKKYSMKIYNILSEIKKSKGIVMIYSQFIEGGCVPIALALEEMGLTRSNGNNLFKNKPTTKRYKFKNNKGKVFLGEYAMITGDPTLSPNNKIELSKATSINNKYGEFVKVIIISRAGSEGLDFKNIRQIHLMEPWYNLNRTNQTIGRAVRNISHCQLPFKERNVEIFLYGTQLNDENKNEAIDLYMYRLAERKTMKINEIAKILKQNALDCVLNKNQLVQYEKKVEIELSSGVTIKDFDVRAKDYSFACEIGECNYTCLLDKDGDFDETIQDKSTYNDYFIVLNLEVLLKKIRFIFSNNYVLHKKQLFLLINQFKEYSNEEIYLALDILINNKNEFIKDLLGRQGKLVNIGDYYMYQPMEIYNKQIRLFNRKTPVEFEPDKITMSIPKTVYKKKGNDNLILEEIEKLYDFLIEEGAVDIKRSTKIERKLYKKVIDYIHSQVRIDKKDMIIYIIHHYIEELPYGSKKRILKSYKSISNVELKNIINNYFRKYSIGKIDDKNVLAIPNEANTMRQYNFYSEESQNTWVENTTNITALTKLLINKYKVVDWKNKWIIPGKEKIIHFYNKYKNGRVVSKIKELGEKTRSSGKQCSVGQNKVKLKKIMDDFESILIEKIMSEPKKERIHENTMTTKEICVAIMLYSYHLTYKYNEKYNFNLLESVLYDVSLLPSLPDDKSGKLDKDGNTAFLIN